MYSESVSINLSVRADSGYYALKNLMESLKISLLGGQS